MKAGIVGLPNVGKSTVFNCLSDAKAQSANYPFCTIEPNIGKVNVPDPRLDTLARLVNPERVVPATVEIVDIAGLVKGASKGEGLGNKFLATIRETDAILHVLRCFDDLNITHSMGDVDPVRDKEIIDTELQLKDLETVEKRLERVAKQAKSGDKNARTEADVLQKIKTYLEQGLSARHIDADPETFEKFIKPLQLLTAKPVLYVCNVDEASLRAGGNDHTKRIEQLAKDEGAQTLIIDARTEAEIAELETFEERQMFLEDLGLEEPGISKLIRKAYALLDLQTFFTAGIKEVRAWTVKHGATAPEAAGVIHTDFQKGFIRAEVISYDDFVHYGSETKAREAGRLRIEGKDYVVQDGDIMHFRFNV